MTSDVNVTISGGNDPHVIKEPVGYNQTGFIIMESHLPHCAVHPVTCLTRDNSLSLSRSFHIFLDLVSTDVNQSLPVNKARGIWS